MNTIGISVISNRTHITLLAEDILYLSLSGRKTVIHITSGRIYETYTPIDELAKNLGSTFIRVDRCYLVSAKAIHDVTKNDRSDQRRIAGLRTPPQAGDRGAAAYRTAKNRSDIGTQ